MHGSNQFEEFSNKNLSQTISSAIGPFVGLEYKFSKRLSIYAEAGYYLNFQYSINSFVTDLTPDRNFETSNFRISDVLNLPSSIILFYSF